MIIHARMFIKAHLMPYKQYPKNVNLIHSLKREFQNRTHLVKTEISYLSVLLRVIFFVIE